MVQAMVTMIHIGGIHTLLKRDMTGHSWEGILMNPIVMMLTIKLRGPITCW